MMRLTTLAVSIALLVSVAHAPGQEKAEDSPYLPLKVGNTWTYQTFDGQKKIALVNKVVAHEKVGDVVCAKVETYVNGMAVAHEHLGATKDGIYRYTFNGQKADKPVLILKLPPKIGDEWKIESKFGDETITGTLKTTEEKVTVEGKKLDAFVGGGKLETKGQAIGAANYFVKDIGIAKIVMEIQGMKLSIELEKFEAAK